jgi:septal ring factor EnvC (AmiA/AmiB activator)
VITFLRRILGISQLELKVKTMFQELAQLEAQINAQTVLVAQVVDAINKLKAQPPVALTADQLAAIDAATAAIAANNATLTATLPL